MQHGYSGRRAYGQSKLANVLFTYELSRRLESTQVTAKVLPPGFVATNLGKDTGWIARLVLRVLDHYRLAAKRAGDNTCRRFWQTRAAACSGR